MAQLAMEQMRRTNLCIATVDNPGRGGEHGPPTCFEYRGLEDNSMDAEAIWLLMAAAFGTLGFVAAVTWALSR
jgi:hypothetical protein